MKYGTEDLLLIFTIYFQVLKTHEIYLTGSFPYLQNLLQGFEKSMKYGRATRPPDFYNLFQSL